MNAAQTNKPENNEEVDPLVEKAHTAFVAAVESLGNTWGQRAQAIGVPLRTFKYWQAGKIPRQWIPIMRPDVLRKMADELERQAA